MELAKISLEQVLILFIMIALGFSLTKLKILKENAKEGLTNLLIYLVVPCMIINSYITSFDESILTNLLYAFLISSLILLIGVAIAYIVCIFYKIEDKPILRFGIMFSNAAYMGFPLISALFGSTGLIYASAFVSIFNILMWTLGYFSVSKTPSVKDTLISILKTPVLYSLIIGLIIFIFQIPIPNIISEPIKLIGNMNTPLSMLIIGIVIATSNLKPVIKNKYLWISILIRLIIVPSIILGIIYLFNFTSIDKDLLKIIFILECTPSASITSVFSIRFKYNQDLASSLVVISTLLSIITLPLWTLAIDYLIV